MKCKISTTNSVRKYNHTGIDSVDVNNEEFHQNQKNRLKYEPNKMKGNISKNSQIRIYIKTKMGAILLEELPFHSLTTIVIKQCQVTVYFGRFISLVSCESQIEESVF